MLEVVEKFVSINGESAHAGELAVFIRFKGCNLNCSYCDTKWANCKDTLAEQISAEELAQWVLDRHIENVTLTGGEPLLQKDITHLIELLTKNGLRVEIETNGSIPLHKFAKMEQRPVFTADYKLPSSRMNKKMCKENFSVLNRHDTVKFVAGSYDDLEKTADVIKQYSLDTKCHVYISPVFGAIQPSEIVDFMIKKNLNRVRVQLQLHKFIWKPDTRGV